MMLVSLGTIMACALLALVPGVVPRLRRWGGPVASVGLLVGLVAHLSLEVFGEGTGVTTVAWPPAMVWLGEPVYRSDALSAGLGAWCLGVGLLYAWLLSSAGGKEPWWKLPVGVLAVGVLYSLVYTVDLRLYSSQALLMGILAWMLGFEMPSNEQEGPGAEENGDQTANSPLLNIQFVGAAIFMLAFTLLAGRATGGDYNLERLPIPVLTGPPLVLLLAAVVLWVGVVPFAGWKARGYSRPQGLLVQALVVGVPVVALLMRLESLVAAGVLGAPPESWAAFTRALAWSGGLTALAAGAGMLVLAGTRQWWFALTSYAMGLTTWTLGLDTPAGRYAALAIFFAWGAARVALDLAGNADRWAPGIFRPRWVLGLAALLLGTMPLTAGFAGAWLLASSLAQTRSAAASTALAGGFVLAACGTGLHFAHTGLPATVSDNKSVDLRALLKTNSGGLSRAVVGLLIAVVLLAGGIVPGLWLPAVASMTGAATTTMSLRWWGIEAGPPWAVFPAVLLAVGALTLAGAGWLALRWAAYRSPAQTSSKLLPAAQERLERYAGSENASPPVELPVPLPAPTPAFSLSLIWLEGALTRLGALALDGCARVGLGLARLEGRYYMPLALVLMLVAVLALAR